MPTTACQGREDLFDLFRERFRAKVEPVMKYLDGIQKAAAVVDGIEVRGLMLKLASASDTLADSVCAFYSRSPEHLLSDDHMRNCRATLREAIGGPIYGVLQDKVEATQ